MPTMSTNYGTKTTIAVTLASLASSSSFLGGRESTLVDNSTDKFVDAQVKGKITVGTTPTANTNINIYVWGSDTSPASEAIDALDGTNSDETLTNSGVLNQLRLAASISVPAATSDITYPIQPFTIAQNFGGVLPKFWGLFVAHNTGVALNSTGGNHEFTYTGIKYDVA